MVVKGCRVIRKGIMEVLTTIKRCEIICSVTRTLYMNVEGRKLCREYCNDGCMNVNMRMRIC